MPEIASLQCTSSRQYHDRRPLAVEPCRSEIARLCETLPGRPAAWPLTFKRRMQRCCKSREMFSAPSVRSDRFVDGARQLRELRLRKSGGADAVRLQNDSHYAVKARRSRA